MAIRPRLCLPWLIQSQPTQIKKDAQASFFVKQKSLILTKQLYNRKILQILLTTSLLFDNITKHQIWGYGSVG